MQSKQGKDSNLTLLVSIPATTTKEEETFGEEMLLPRTLEIKFGEEYSSSEYYILPYLYCYSMTMRRKTYKMISNKKDRISYYV